MAYQLDSMTQQEDYTPLSKLLMDLPLDTNASIFVYTTPEKLTVSPWNTIIDDLICKHIIRLIFVDEVHQFMSFASLIWFEICKLKDSLFKN